MKKFLILGLAALAMLPAAVQAQRKDKVYIVEQRCCYVNRFSIEPYFGALKDAYDIGAADDTGFLLGFRVAYLLGRRWRLLGNFSYSNTGDVFNSDDATDYFVYDNVWAITTAGGEFHIIPGRTSVALGLQAGVGWRQLDFEGAVGEPEGSPLDKRGFKAYDMLLPSLTLRYETTTRTSVSLVLSDNMFAVFSGTTQNSPALSFGVSFR
jgi:hypothetical protein